MSGGTVNLSRAFWDDEAFRNEPFTQREAFLWFITEASWKDRTRRFGDKVVHLKRGELAASVRFMATAWKWTPAKVQRFLEKLKSSEKICLKTDTGVTVVSVCKYNDYQNKPGATDTAAIQHRYSTDTNENKGEIRGNNKPPKSPLRDGDAIAVLSAIVPPDVAASFAAHRRDLKKPLTERAAKIIVGKLDGHGNARAVIEDSIANGWQGVFPDKTKPAAMERAGEIW